MRTAEGIHTHNGQRVRALATADQILEHIAMYPEEAATRRDMLAIYIHLEIARAVRATQARERRRQR